MEKQKFEDSWEEAFQGAEVSPSESLWTNIELDLEKAEGGKMRRRLLLFKWAAAASIILAFGMGGLYYFNQQNGTASNLTLHKELLPSSNGIVSSPERQEALENKAIETEKSTEEASLQAEKSSTSIPIENSPNINATKRNNSGKNDGHTTNVEKSTSSSVVLTVAASDGDPRLSTVSQTLSENRVYQFSLNEKKLPPIVVVKKIEPNFHSSEADPLILLLARLDQEKKVVKTKSDTRSEKLWTSVGFAAGAFNTITSGSPALQQSNSPAFNIASSGVMNSQTKASGVTYSTGFNVGARLSKHWVVQGGFNYLMQSSEYTTNTVISSADFKSVRPATVNEFYNLDAAVAQPMFTAPYNVNNSLQFVSFPLQAGYLVVNHNLGLQVNAGVSTDLFLQNTITPQNENLNKVTQESGEDSPYRTVNFSGLLGTEFSYRFREHYRIALNPGIRYPINSIYKSEVGVSAAPLTFDVGLRLRYIFQ